VETTHFRRLNSISAIGFVFRASKSTTMQEITTLGGFAQLLHIPTRLICFLPTTQNNKTKTYVHHDAFGIYIYNYRPKLMYTVVSLHWLHNVHGQRINTVFRTYRWTLDTAVAVSPRKSTRYTRTKSAVSVSETAAMTMQNAEGTAASRAFFTTETASVCITLLY
jgi:hypothetical protein